MIDSHTHLNLEPLLSGYTTYLNTAFELGVDHMMIVGTDVATSTIAVGMAKKHPQLWASVGVHPEEATSRQVGQVRQDLERLIAGGDVTAIGECGLDYSGGVDHEAQKELFLMHVDLALIHELPVLIHCRNTRKPDEVVSHDAYSDVLELLQSQTVPKFVLHCVSGPVSYVQKALELGAYVSFAGNVTYPNAHAIRDILKIVPTDRLLLETDAPFLSPQTKRGQTNEPAFVTETATFIAEFLGKTYEEIDVATTNNTLAFFSR
jgi:TatD DNase family protein